MGTSLPAPQSALTEVPDTYISYTIDVSYLLGGRWWGTEERSACGVGTAVVPPLDLKNKALLKWASYLSPAYLRVGGTEADRVYYALKKKEPVPSKPVVDYQLVLKKKQWKQLIRFTKKVGARLVFTLNCGWSDRLPDGSWDSSNARRLIAYTARKRLPVVAWELGNEVNGYPFLEGIKYAIPARQYAEDFYLFSHLVEELHPEAQSVGPASAFWPIIGEPNPVIPTLVESGVLGPKDVVSWHYYPFQSNRGKYRIRKITLKRILSPTLFMEGERYAQRLKKLVKERELWLTETGSALYGGEEGISDTYASTLWWLNLLGSMARSGVTRLFRQTLVGSDYGLLNPETFEPRPDYYVTFLWKKLMGGVVYALGDPALKTIRWYCHSTRGKRNRFTYVVLNLSSKSVQLEATPSLKERYILSAAGPLSSHYLLLNGELVEEDLVTQWRKKKTKEKYKVNQKKEEPALEIPPYGSAFLVVKS